MKVDFSSNYQNFDSAVYDELFEYKNQNPLHWPALHYALLAHRLDLAKLALEFFPEEGNRTARASQVVGLWHWNPPAPFQDWDWFEGHDILFYSWEVAAIYGYEDFAIQLLQNAPTQPHLDLATPWSSKEHRERLYCVALQLGQSQLLDYLFSRGVPMNLEMPKMTSEPFWPLLDNQEMMRVFLYHHMLRSHQEEIYTLEDVPEHLIAAAMNYAAKGESPLQGAFNARHFDDFRLFVEMGLETFGQDGLELFQRALKESDSRYLMVLCNKNQVDAKLWAAVNANRLDVVQALYPLSSRKGGWPLSEYYDRGMKEIVSFLLSQEVSSRAYNLLDRRSYDLLDKAILAHDHNFVEDLLGRKGCYDSLCISAHPLRAAVWANEPTILNRLLDSGFRVHIVPHLKNEIFFYWEAGKTNASEVFQALMDRGLPPAPQDYQLLTKNGYLSELKLLIERFSPEKSVLCDLLSEAARANQKEVFDFLSVELQKKA